MFLQNDQQIDMNFIKIIRKKVSLERIFFYAKNRS